jgi:hypothetical protein
MNLMQEFVVQGHILSTGGDTLNTDRGLRLAMLYKIGKIQTEKLENEVISTFSIYRNWEVSTFNT